MTRSTAPRHVSRRLKIAAASVALALITTLVPGAVASTAATTTATTSSDAKPTIVLVHGAFADASGWTRVTKRLQERGYTVLAPPNQLRSLVGDSENLRLFLSTISGPIVLVGHSYGGAVVTNAATGNDQVKALVYINAYALAEGESVADANQLGGGHSDLLEHIVTRPYDGAEEGDADVYIDPAFYRELFAADLARKRTEIFATQQRPAAFSVLIAPSGEPAWESIPSWYMVSSRDKTIPPEAERAMAERAGATTVEIRSSHSAMVSHADEVTDMVLEAAKS